MSSINEQVLRATKEIVVKFIEVGRISPTNFHDNFKDIYATIDDSVKSARNLSAGQNESDK